MQLKDCLRTFRHSTLPRSPLVDVLAESSGGLHSDCYCLLCLVTANGCIHFEGEKSGHGHCLLTCFVWFGDVSICMRRGWYPDDNKK